MGTIATILNKVSCGQGIGSNRGTGGKFCPIDIKQPTVLVLTPKGLKVPASTVFDLQYMQELQQKEKAFVLKGIVNFNDATPDNEIGTRDSTGEKYLMNKLPYELQFTFDRGLYNYKALTKFESNKLYDLWIYDVKNDLFNSVNSDGSARGLDAGMITIANYKIGKENGYMMTIQVDRTDFDENISWMTSENLGYKAERELDGYNDVEIKLVAPANAATKLKFQIYAVANNNQVPLDGLVVGDFLVKKGTSLTAINTTVTASALAPTVNSGEYELTVPAVATGEYYSLQLFDSTLNASIVLLEDVLFKSNLATTAVV